MAHRFVVLVGKELKTYTRFEDIGEFDHLIEFKPEIAAPPHTSEQHAEIENWNSRLQELMRREHASRNANR